MKRHGTAWPLVVLVLGVAFCRALVLCTPPEPAAARAPSAVPDVERLIEDLGSKDFDVREAATRALKELDEAPPALRWALGAADLEVRRRAADILEGIEQRRALRGLARAEALAKEGRIVEAVDRIVAFAGRDKEAAGGQILTRFAARLLEAIPPDDLRRMERLDLERGQKHFPAGNYRKYATSGRVKQIVGAKLSYRANPLPNETGLFFARGEEVSLDGGPIQLSLVAASGDVRSSAAPRASVVIAGGDLTIGAANTTLIVCDGDVEFRGGDARFPNIATECLILARGKIRSPHIYDCVIRSEGAIAIFDPHGKKVALKEGTPDPFAFVKFFELSDVGLTVAERDGQGEAVRDGVCIQEVRKGTMFASTLQAGDILTAVEGTKATSKEDFRRLLRKRLARGGPRITFTVRRAGQTSDLAVPVKD
jgi:hypothetical protein